LAGAWLEYFARIMLEIVTKRAKIPKSLYTYTAIKYQRVGYNERK